MAEFRRYTCPVCQGTGKAFTCEKRKASDGACCPGGVRRETCPGKFATCSYCGGTGIRRYLTIDSRF